MVMQPDLGPPVRMSRSRGADTSKAPPSPQDRRLPGWPLRSTWPQDHLRGAPITARTGRAWRAITAAGVAGALAACSHATPATLDRPTYTRELQKLADGYSGAVAVVVTPEATWKGAVGWADL